MALYVYQGFWQDNLNSTGNDRVWTTGNFSLALIQDDPLLDSSSGLNFIDAQNWASLAAQPNVVEMPGIPTTNYVRKVLAGTRTFNWDSDSTPREAELQYDNAGSPLTWADLTAGYTIGAYVLLRTDDGAGNDVPWMADTGATGLPATTNGEDLTVTVNIEGILKGWQPSQP